MITPVKNRLLNILLADDGSLNARAAAKFLADLPHHDDAAITVLRVFTPLDAAEYANVAASVQRTRNMLTSRHLKAKIELILGYPAEKIISYAEANSPDLIVMGAKGAGTILGNLVGSVANSVVHDGRWPVLVVREPYEHLRKILLVTDGSDCSQAAAHFLGGFPLPKQVGAVDVMHVVPVIRPVYAAEPSGMVILAMTPEEQEIVRNENDARGRIVLDETCATLSAHGVETVPVLAYGEAAIEIGEYVRKNQIDLVVCGSRGLGNMTGLLLGSVSRELLVNAPCSVLVVRSHR